MVQKRGESKTLSGVRGEGLQPRWEAGALLESGRISTTDFGMGQITSAHSSDSTEES